jgi:AcrR family transcriptional regulator
LLLSVSETDNQAKTMTPQADTTRRKVTTEKRKYHSPLRQQQAAETRQRIVAAGTELVHGFQSWDWKNLTARAVGERAGVSERTVQRYFPSERALRDAVLQGLVEESGVDLNHLNLSGFDDVVINMFNYLSSFAVEPDLSVDPSQTKMDESRKKALFDAVVDATPNFSREEQEMVAAILDMLWQPSTHDRFRQAWDLDAERFTRVIRWFTALIQSALGEGSKP